MSRARDREIADLRERWQAMAAEREGYVRRVGKIGWQAEKDRRRLARLLASRYSNLAHTLVVSEGKAA